MELKLGNETFNVTLPELSVLSKQVRRMQKEMHGKHCAWTRMMLGDQIPWSALRAASPDELTKMFFKFGDEIDRLITEELAKRERATQTLVAARQKN